MFYILYQITNKLNGKIYIGVHKTRNLNDGYMGSGTIIKRAIEKHGIDNFSKVILEQFDNPKDMYAREKEIVNTEFLSRSDVYNLQSGGNGGFDYINRSGFNGTAKGVARRTELLNTDWKRTWKVAQQAGVAKVSPHRQGGFKKPEIQQLGNSPAAREKAKVTQRATYAITGHSKGEKNSQYGTCWVVHNVFGNKKIKKELLPSYIEQGWTKGRRMK